MLLNSTELFTIFGAGILAVTLIDVLGSISSRKMNYTYAYLSPLSFLVYGLVGYYAYHTATITWMYLISCVVGVYDGTIGWKLSIILKANFGKYEESSKTMSPSMRIAGMLLVSGVFGYIGFEIASFIN